jgi:hypothetical protein
VVGKDQLEGVPLDRVRILNRDRPVVVEVPIVDLGGGGAREPRREAQGAKREVRASQPGT